MFHRANRRRLEQVANGALIVLTGYDAMQWTGDMDMPFMQESSFWWLTGIDEPGWKAVLETSRARLTLVRPEQSEIERVFLGGVSDDEVMQLSGADEVIAMEEFETRLRHLSKLHPVVETIIDRRPYSSSAPNPAPITLHKVLKRTFTKVENCQQTIQRLRAIKQPEELMRIRRAIELTVEAFKAVRQEYSAFKTEYEIEAEFTYKFRRANAMHAYQSIVASGAHACVLHYGHNSGKLSTRAMTVIDVGARVDGYSADITRTYCLNPTKRQRVVHRALVQAQRDIVALIHPGVSVVEYVSRSDEIMKTALACLDLLKDPHDTETFRRYYPHATSHGLGVDTHDSLGQPRIFEPGMVLTVEPGIYIPEEGIGVRIDDDILVTETGNDNLSASLSTEL